MTSPVPAFTRAFVTYMDLYRVLVHSGAKDEPSAKRLLYVQGHETVRLAPDGVKPYLDAFVTAIDNLPTLSVQKDSAELSSIHAALKDKHVLADHFIGQGLTLCLGMNTLDGESYFIDACLGPTKTIRLNAVPAVIFEERLIDKLVSSYAPSGTYAPSVAWTDGTTRYYDMEEYKRCGKYLFDTIGRTTGRNESPLQRHRRWAWQPLLETCHGDEPRFVTACSAYLLGDSHIHELHHTDFLPDSFQDDLKVAEMSADLYMIARAINPIDAVRRLEEFTRSSSLFYAQIGASCLDYLDRAGYTKTFFKSPPTDTSVWAKAARYVQDKAQDALTRLETEHGLPRHEAVENRLGIDWPRYREDVEEKLVRPRL